MKYQSKEKKRLIFIVVSIFFLMIGTVVAIQITTFDNSLTSENLTFTGNENFTRNITLYKNANVTSAFMNLSGQLSFNWSSNSSIISGLGDIGDWSSPTVFQKDNTWYLIGGEFAGNFNGFNWTGSTWQSDTNIVSGLGDIGSVSDLTVFQKDNTWYLISGEFNGNFNGFNWTGSTWQSDTNIVSGLGDIGTVSSPTVFQKDNTWYLIGGYETGGDTPGNFKGFNWTGSTWQSDTNIVSGLYSNGFDIMPTAISIDSNLLLFVGSTNINNNEDGNITGFIWDNNSWIYNSFIIIGLNYSSRPKVAIFNNNIENMIVGNVAGKFNGSDSPKNYATNPSIKINNTNIWSISYAQLINQDAYLNKLNDSTSSKNLTFTGNENQTVYLKILKHSNVTSAFINLSGLSIAFDSDLSDPDRDGNILNNPAVNFMGTIFKAGQEMNISNNKVDKVGFYIQRFGSPDGTVNITIRKTSDFSILDTKELGTASSLSNGLNEVNFTVEPLINERVFILLELIGNTNADGSNGLKLFKTQNQVNVIDNQGGVGYNSTDYQVINSGEVDYLYNITYINNYPTSPYIKINNTNIWNHTGEFNSTFSPNKTEDFSSTLNTYLNTCSANSENYCDVPLKTHSDTAGVLQVDSINVTYTNISKTLDFSSTLNTALNSGACDCTGCTLSGNNCTIEFIFHSDTAGILEYSDININWLEYTPPTYSNVAHNQTVNGTLTNFSVLWNDETALHTNGQYIFSTNNTGVWVNDSAINFTTTSSWANVEKTLNDTVGIAIGYRWYGTDNGGNQNDTGIQVLVTNLEPVLNTRDIVQTITLSSSLDVHPNFIKSIFQSITTNLGLDTLGEFIKNLAQSITTNLNLKTIKGRLVNLAQTITTNLGLDVVANFFRNITQTISVNIGGLFTNFIEFIQQIIGGGGGGDVIPPIEEVIEEDLKEKKGINALLDSIFIAMIVGISVIFILIIDYLRRDRKLRGIKKLSRLAQIVIIIIAIITIFFLAGFLRTLNA